MRVNHLEDCPKVNRGPFLQEEKEFVGAIASRLRRLIVHREVEGALQQERDFSTAILSSLDALVVVLDSKGRIVIFNRACELLSGNREEEMQGRLFHEVFLLTEETEQVRTVFDALRSGHAPLRFRNHWRTRDGDSRLIEWSNTMLRNDVGIITHIIGTETDVTNLKKTS